MLFKDLDIFLRAAAAILQARDPYSIPNLEVFYPLPFYFLFIPLVALPAQVVYAAWTALQAVILVALLRGRTAFVALSMPVLLTFILGQVDIVMLGLFMALSCGTAGAVALAFLVLKPQLVLLLAPWMLWNWLRRDRRLLIVFLVVIGVIVLASFVVQPDWPVRFLARSGERTRAAISSSLWGLLSILPASLWLPITALVAGALVLCVWRKNNLNLVAAIGLFVSPYVFSYNLVPLLALIRKPMFLIGFTLLSWLTFAISAWQSNDRADALLTLFAFVFLVQSTRTRSERMPLSKGAG